MLWTFSLASLLGSVFASGDWTFWKSLSQGLLHRKTSVFWRSEKRWNKDVTPMFVCRLFVFPTKNIMDNYNKSTLSTLLIYENPRVDHQLLSILRVFFFLSKQLPFTCLGSEFVTLAANIIRDSSSRKKSSHNLINIRCQSINYKIMQLGMPPSSNSHHPRWHYITRLEDSPPIRTFMAATIVTWVGFLHPKRYDRSCE